jgi:indolepyruvate ferredoxin oxidoreductase
MERQWIADYFAAVGELVDGLTRDNLALAAEIASVPEHIRGFGHVKEHHEKLAREQWTTLLARWRKPEAARAAA